MRIFLCGFKRLPFSVPAGEADKVSQIKTLEALRRILELGVKDVLLVVRVDELDARHVTGIHALMMKYSFKVLFYAHRVSGSFLEKYRGVGGGIQVLLSSEPFPSFEALKRMVLQGTKMRKEQRTPLKAKVIIKNSTYSACGSALVRSVKVILEGYFEDFSRNGARIRLEKAPFRVKDLLCLMYQDVSGSWIEVESQVRWVSAEADSETLGLQFLGRTA